MAVDTRIEDFEAAKKQHEANNAKLIRLDEQYNNAKKKLKGVVDEIVALGYDPKTFDVEVQRLDTAFTEDLSKYKAEVAAQTQAIKDIEASL